ncbi:MAG TPA: glucokinase [Acidobacteriaceae bacterium]
MILAGDVGGTKVHLALYSFEQGRLQKVREKKFPAQNYDGLEKIVLEFLSGETELITAACFGCPGPVKDNRLKLTNLPWTLDGHLLSGELNIDHVFLINDLEANGYGIPELGPEAIFTLHEGDPGSVGHRALISAGTGLGEAVLIWNGRIHLPIPSEGGHADFAARNDLEIEMLQYLRATLKGRVSWERVVSGLGLKNIYGFLRDAKKMDEPEWLKARIAKEDQNAVIGDCGGKNPGEEGYSELCAKTLEMFVSAYGAEAGNSALKVLASGGIYLGGGIAPKILKKMQDGTFTQAYLDKGRLSPLLETIPVRVILDDSCALMGAAAYAEARSAAISGSSERAASVAV